jgi:hypothetical protein
MRVWLALVVADAKDMSLPMQDPYQRQIGEIKVDGGGVFATFGVPEVTLWKVGESRSFQVWYGLTLHLSSIAAVSSRCSDSAENPHIVQGPQQHVPAAAAQQHVLQDLGRVPFAQLGPGRHRFVRLALLLLFRLNFSLSDSLTHRLFRNGLLSYYQIPPVL